MMGRRKSATLTDPQKRTLEIIYRFLADKGYPPSIRDIKTLGKFSSTSVVNYYLVQLEAMGHIDRSGHVSRGIRLLKPYDESGQAVTQSPGNMVREMVEKAQDLLRIPVMGRIVASQPVPVPPSDFNYMDAEHVLDIARSMLPSKEKVESLYALEVQGDSMIDAMVNDGDYVIMRPAQTANNGEMVAVWLRGDDETTLKYFYLENGRVRLQPANPTMEPIYIDDPRKVQIQGKVIMVVRRVNSRAS
jgi:repressor LexA